MTKFSAQIDEWVAKSRARIEAVVKESTQRTVDIMQTPVAKGGNMPVDTGFLRNSLMASQNGFVPANRKNPGGQARNNTGDIVMAIAGFDVGEMLYFSYTANYARPVHFGARGRPGRQFVTLAAQRWKSTVSQVALEARQRAGR